MILSNVAIMDALDSGHLAIRPEPAPRPNQPGNASPYGASSVDLRLGPHLRVPVNLPILVDLTQSGGSVSEFLQRNSNAFSTPFDLQPQQFLLAQTLEEVHLPIPEDGGTCLAARIEGKSSFARLGLLVHFTAPTIQAGFEGRLTLEMINLGPNVIRLTEGMRIAQLIVEEVRGIPIYYQSQFQGQSRPEGKTQ